MDPRDESPVSVASPTVCLVLPCHVDGPDLRACLAAIGRLDPPPDQVVVAVDGGHPVLCAVVEPHADVVVPVVPRSGPAVARNLAARHATTDVLWFVDADVEVHADGVGRVREVLRDGAVTGVIGSYDDAPPVEGVVATYKNLRNHHVHHHADREARTFWGACGAIRREAFLAVGGFDGTTYPRPSIEDIELGYRLVDAGHRLRLDPRLQVTHRKDWSLRQLVSTDVTRRALPWGELLLSRGGLDDDLDVDVAGRAKVALSWGAVAAALLPARSVSARVRRVVALLTVVARLDLDLLRTFARVRGAPFAATAFPLHVLTHLYAGATFAVAVVRHLGGWSRVPSGRREPLSPILPMHDERSTQ